MVAKQTICISCGGPVLSMKKVKKRCYTCEDKLRVMKDRARRRIRNKAKKEVENVTK